MAAANAADHHLPLGAGDIVASDFLCQGNHPRGGTVCPIVCCIRYFPPCPTFGASSAFGRANSPRSPRPDLAVNRGATNDIANFGFCELDYPQLCALFPVVCCIRNVLPRPVF